MQTDSRVWDCGLTRVRHQPVYKERETSDSLSGTEDKTVKDFTIKKKKKKTYPGIFIRHARPVLLETKRRRVQGHT